MKLNILFFATTFGFAIHETNNNRINNLNDKMDRCVLRSIQNKFGRLDIKDLIRLLDTENTQIIFFRCLKKRVVYSLF